MTTDTQPDSQPAAPLPQFMCPECGADLLRTGFIVATISYQAYEKGPGEALVKSYRKKSGIQDVHCTLCHAKVLVSAEVLTGAASK